MELNHQHPLASVEELLNRLRPTALLMATVMSSRDALEPDGTMREDLTEAIGYMMVNIMVDLRDLEEVVDIIRQRWRDDREPEKARAVKVA